MVIILLLLFWIFTKPIHGIVNLQIIIPLVYEIKPTQTPTDSQPTPTNPQPTPTDSQPTPTNPQPTPTDSQPTPTNPQPTPTDSQPTPTTTLIKPDTGIILTEFMPYSSIEWIEIYNGNDKSVELKNWKIKNNLSNTKPIPDMKISAKSYNVFLFLKGFLNDDSDKIILLNHNDQVIGQWEYHKVKSEDNSWSYISGSWCQAENTQNKANALSCNSPTPKLTETVSPTSILTPTINQVNNTLYKPDESATASAIFTPTEESGYYATPTTSLAPISSNLVLGETTTAKKNNLPLVFIISGGLLLVSPVILSKLKKK